MSRSFVRMMAGFALVAVPMVSVQAQASCTVPTNGGSCPVAFNATLTVPVLASLSHTAGTALAFPAPDWNAFFLAPALTYTVSQAQFTVRSNSPYSVAMSATAWTQPGSAGRVVNDVTFGLLPSGGTCAAGTVQAGTIGTTPVVAGGVPGSVTRELCLALEIPGDLASNKLVPGAYSLPITMTISAP
jgi:hypothetical protein